MNELYGSGDSRSGYEHPLNWNEHKKKKMRISRLYLDIKTATVIILM